MESAVFEKLNEPLVIDDLKIPDLETGQVLVRVMASGICGKQIGEISGHYGEDKYLPHLLGHEGGGIVEKTGPGVTLVKPGDHVVMHWRKGSGIEAKPAKYKRKDGSTVGGGPVHTFCEYAVVSENRLTPIPKDVPFNIGALFGCAITTGLGLVSNEAQLKIGQSIAVFGCGGVGLSVIQGAALAGAYPIIAIDKIQEKVDTAKKFGATNGYIANGFSGQAFHTSFKGFDVFVDTTGNPDCIALAYDLTAPQGKTILVGQPKQGVPVSLNSMMSGKRIFASQGGLTNPTENIPQYVRLYQAGKLDCSDMITDIVKLKDINYGIDRMKSGKTIRCIVSME